MKLMEEYVITKSYKIWSWVFIYILFFAFFYEHIRGLFAGGVLFVYECMVAVFVLRYVRQFLYIRTANLLGKDVEGRPWNLNPTFWSSSKFKLQEVLILELRPMIILTGVQACLIAISHFAFSAEYVTPILGGSLLLSMALYNQSYITLYRCIRHSSATYKYGPNAFSVYKEESLNGWPTSEKLIKTILRGSN